MTEAEKEHAQKKWKVWLTIFTFVALGGMVYALRHQIFEVVQNFGEVNTWALLIMIPAQLLNYDAYARMYRKLLNTLGEDVSYRNLYRVQLELNFVNNVFPSGGVSGFSYFGLRMRDYGVSAGKATLVQVMKFGLIFISFQILLLVGLFCLAVVGRTSNLTILVAASMATLLVVMTLGSIFIISSEKRINSFFTYITRVINRLIRIVRPKHPETINIVKVQTLFSELHENYMYLQQNWRQLKMPLIFALLANLTEILTIYIVYIAFGRLVNPGAVIIAYAIANFAGLVSVLPGGVGIYEGLMTAVLATAGVSPALSIPVTVMYRVLNMLIQLPPGYYFYHKVLHKSA